MDKKPKTEKAKKPEEKKVEEKDKIIIEEKPEEIETQIIYEDEFTPNKEEKKAEEKKPEEPKSSRKGAVALIIFIALVALVIFNWQNFFPKTQDVAATVNGQQIMQADIDAEYNRLPDFYKQMVTKDEILNRTIDKTILKQEAKKNGFTVTKDEIDQGVKDLAAGNGMSQEQFDEFIKTNNLSIEEVRTNVEETLLFSKYLNETIISKITVTDAEIKAYYDNNTDLFRTAEQKNVSHILICYTGADRCEKNRTKEQAAILANELLKKAKTEDFAKLADENSDDKSAEGGNLGLINAETPFVEQFLKEALKLKKGEISSIVETQFGFHIIKANSIIPEKTASLADSKEQIELALKNEKATEEIKVLIAGLRSKADITIAGKSSCDVTGAIFYTADWCAPCNETEKAVNELISEGKAIRKVKVADNDLVKTCFKSEMKEDIPQIICKGYSQTGQMTKESISAFIAKCG